MRKVLFIAAIITFSLTFNSCESDSNLTSEEKQELLDIKAKDGDTGKDEVTDDDV